MVINNNPKLRMRAEPVNSEQPLTPMQRSIQEMIGGRNRTWGTGANLPKRLRTLEEGEGLIKNGDEGKTASMFGIRSIKRRYS